MAGEKAVKEYKNKYERMENLLSEAKQRLKNKKDSLSNTEANQIENF